MMAEDTAGSGESSLSLGNQTKHISELSTANLMFQKDFASDTDTAVSTEEQTNSINSKYLEVMKNLETSGSHSTTSFSLEDITTSCGSGTHGSDVVVSDISSSFQTVNMTSPGFSLVDRGGGEFMVVTSNSDVIGLGASGVISHEGQTMSLNMEGGGQFLLDQRGITQAVELPDGSFQIIEHPIMQVKREDGTIETQALSLDVLQALQGELSQQLPHVNTSFDTTENIDGLNEVSSSSGIKIERDLELDTGDIVEEKLDSVKVPSTTCDTSPAEEDDNTLADSGKESKEEEVMGENNGEEKLLEENGVSGNNEAQPGQNHAEGKKVSKKETHEKQPDLSNPIPLSEQTVITVKGKKCVLAFNQDTQQVCAYPLKPPPGSKRRGRPRLTQEEKDALAEKRKQQQLQESRKPQQSPSEKSSAAETLLELSNIGSDGVRRSARKRKSTKLLEEFEELEDSDEDEPFLDNQEKDPDITLNLPDFKKKKQAKTDKEPEIPTVIVTSAPTAPPVKRGRGRPRRYPPPGQQQIPTSIPAFMIPSANGQSIVMTPIQGLHNVQNLRRQLPNLVPKPPEDTAIPNISNTDTIDTNTLSLGNDTDGLPLDTCGVLDSNSIIPTALQGDSIPLVGDHHDISDTGDTMDSPDKLKESLSSEEIDNPVQPTVIQIPDNLLPLLGIKKDPVKIGLKASEGELEKLKCPKCDFQGYYTQQYRTHIATHGDDIQKCKCCSYLSLDSEELLSHFKEFHPRCICSECGYMAEHAYIIKRHMMRHDTKSCTCHVCGKVYKDMYILKMHVKMVHMPAEVLFECNICSKKFTRKAHLKRHLRIHEPEKPFKCPVCDYRGCERSDISKHMLIHEEPKHACERCGKTFRHIKNKELHVKRHYGQRDYKCGVCDFFGYTFTDIRKHIERKHQDIKMLICDKCNKHFRTEWALKEHQQTCNVMMIEQVLAIPTSAGGTNQATIQIPANLGPERQIILDGQAITLDVQSFSVNKHGGVNIMVTEQGLGITDGVTEEDENEDMEDEDPGIDQAMHIIGETIMTEAGEEMQIVPPESLENTDQIISHADIEQLMAAQAVTEQNAAVQNDSQPQIQQILVPECGPMDNLSESIDSNPEHIVHQFMDQESGVIKEETDGTEAMRNSSSKDNINSQTEVREDAEIKEES